MGEMSVYCGSCLQALNEPPSLPDGKRHACPNCGSLLRHITVDIQETIRLCEQLKVQVEEEGENRPIMEQVQGDDQFRKTGEWMKKIRIIDRKNDQYKEVVTDPKSGQILHHSEEPLSQHQQHGSARRAKD